MSDTKKEKIIGIDLGTSNSAASVLVGGKPTVVPSAEGASQYGKAFPSYVAFTDDGQMLVGEPARRQAVTNPEKKYGNRLQSYNPRQTILPTRNLCIHLAKNQKRCRILFRRKS